MLLIVMTLAISGTLWHMRRTAIHEAGLAVSKLGTTISEQTVRVIQGADMVLSGLRGQIQAAGITTPEGFRAYFSNEATFRELRRSAEELPQINALTIIGADGRLVNFSREWPVPDTNLSDRDYFEYLRTHDDGTVYVSHVFRNRGDGGLTAYVIRRVDGPDGQFLGILLGALDLDYFSSFYKLISADDTSVSLIRTDGTVLTSYPPMAHPVEKLPSPAPWYAETQRGGGVYTTIGSLHGVPRLMSVHVLPDYPLTVNVGMSYRQILAPWGKEAMLIIAGAVCALLCVGLLLRALVKQLHGLEQSEAFLVAQNDTLHQAQERMRVQAAMLSFNQTELAEKTAILETTLETMNQGLLTVDELGRVSIYNRRVEEMLGVPPGFLANKPAFADLVTYQRETGEFDVQQVPVFCRTGGVAEAPPRYERVRPDGSTLEIHTIKLENGGMVRTFTDISDRRRSEQQLHYFARHDSLTKLVNRMTFHERLEKAIAEADEVGCAAAVLCLDLDRFKQVNDTRGHATGDKLLAEVAARLLAVVRDTDTVARMGGDEFAIVQRVVIDPRETEALATRLLDAIARPYEIDGRPTLIGLSVGIALYPTHGGTAGGLLRNADTALYRAKADGGGVFRLFDESMEAAKRSLFQLEQDLRQALEEGSLHLAYQPIVDATTREISSYEALLRWNHPVRGPISPAEFIPLAESSGLIVPIGLWVLETACAEANTWPDHVRVSVNLSPVQFRQGDLVELVTGVLERTGLAPDRLSLEVTEGLLLDGTQQVLGMMGELRALGVRFSLDDFGTAHAGLSYLRCFPFDAIKIDKSFVKDAVSHMESRAIVRTILAMASVLKLNVIAEGVETEEQLRLLRQLRCRQIQGYLTGRPMAAAAIAAQHWPARRQRTLVLEAAGA